MTNGANPNMQAAYEPRETGTVIVKSALKVAGAICLIIQFMFFHQFLAILAALIFYFTLPSRYRTDRVAECLEAYIRPGIGLFLSVYVGWVLSGAAGGIDFQSLVWYIVFWLAVVLILIPVFLIFKSYKLLNTILPIVVAFIISLIFGTVHTTINPLFSSIFAISALIFAFYCVMPIREVSKIDEKQIIIVPVINAKRLEKAADFLSGENRDPIGNAIFAALMTMSLASLLQMSGFGPAGWFNIPIMTVIMCIFWFIALVIGTAATQEARPYVGSLVLIMAIFVFSFQYTGVVGTALFGNWWPTIEHGISIIAQPLGDAYSTMQNQMRCLQILMTNPALYSTTPGCGAPMPQTEAVGSVSAVQIEDLDAINGVTGENNIYADAPLIGTFTIRNAGDFVASDMWVKTEPIELKDPTKASAAHPEQAYVSISEWGNNKCIFQSCTGIEAKNIERCEWNEEIFKDYKALVTFKCGSPGNDFKNWTYTIQCVNQNTGGIDRGPCNGDCCDSSTTCGTGDVKLYCHAGWFVSIPFKYGFTYSVNASAPVVVMNASVFQKKLLAKEISLEEKETKYTGGPVEIAIWTQKQPLRSDETSYGRIMIINRGEGNITSLNGTLRFNASAISISNIQVISKYPSSKDIDCGVADNSLSFNITNGLTKDEMRYCTFSFNAITDPNVDSATGLFTTNITYSFVGEKRMEIQIGNAPIQ